MNLKIPHAMHKAFRQKARKVNKTTMQKVAILLIKGYLSS